MPDPPASATATRDAAGHAPVHQSVARALAVLSAFDDARTELGVAELSRALGLHKSTVSRLAATLERARYLRRHDDRYRLGTEVLRLGAVASSGFDLITALRPEMERLSGLCGETVNLAVADGEWVLNIAEIPSAFILSSSAGWNGRRTAPHAAANGKVLLAYGALRIPEGAVLERYTARTVTSRRGLAAELDETRRRGYATAVSELEEGLAAVATPVFEADGRCVAALSVSGPESRLGPDALAELGKLATHG